MVGYALVRNDLDYFRRCIYMNEVEALEPCSCAMVRGLAEVEA